MNRFFSRLRNFRSQHVSLMIVSLVFVGHSSKAFGDVVLTLNDTVNVAGGNEGTGQQNTAVAANFASNIGPGHPLLTDTNGNTRVNAFDSGSGLTPNIALNWSTTQNVAGGATLRWEFHAWGGAAAAAQGGALQLNGADAGVNDTGSGFTDSDVFSVQFSPDSGFGVTLGGFNFIGDTNNDTYQFDWRVFDVTNNVVASSGRTAQWTTLINNANPGGFNGAPQVNLNFTGVADTVYRLDLARVGGVGVSAASGVDIAIDNLQFGQFAAIPEPGSFVVLGLSVLGFAVRRRRA